MLNSLYKQSEVMSDASKVVQEATLSAIGHVADAGKDYVSKVIDMSGRFTGVGKEYVSKVKDAGKFATENTLHAAREAKNTITRVVAKTLKQASGKKKR